MRGDWRGLSNIIKLGISVGLLGLIASGVTLAQTPSPRTLTEVRDLVGLTAWHTAGYEGQGVKIGIIDVGFEGVDTTMVALSEIPRPSTQNHGTLVLEVLRSLAPQADFYLFQLNSVGSNVNEAVNWMLAQGVQVVNYSAVGLDLPLNGDNHQAQQMARLADTDVVVVVSMGNYGLGFLQDTYRDQDGDGWHEFVGGYESVTVTPFLSELFGVAHLRWQEAVYTSAQHDFDLYILSPDGTSVLAAATEVQQGGSADWAYEDVFYETGANFSFQIAVRAKQPDAISTGAVFYLYVEDAWIDGFSPEGSITAPADSAKVLSIGAVESTDELWQRSSRGPTWDARIKPDLVAPTRLQLEGEEFSFTGTSASAPIVAGVAAIVRQAFPELTAAEVRHWLQTNAQDMGAVGVDNLYGYGLVWLPPPQQ